MNDRLKELLRQRKLIQDHLAWLDREIAAATGNAESVSRALSPGSSTPLPALAPGPVPGDDATPATEENDPLLAEYRREPEILKADVKRGCVIYFSIGMAIIFLGVFLLYLHYAHRPASAPTVNVNTRPTESKR